VVKIGNGIDTGQPIGRQLHDIGVDITEQQNGSNISAYLQDNQEAKGTNEFGRELHLGAHTLLLLLG
jgi:hypothetical protein